MYERGIGWIPTQSISHIKVTNNGTLTTHMVSVWQNKNLHGTVSLKASIIGTKAQRAKIRCPRFKALHDGYRFSWFTETVVADENI